MSYFDSFDPQVLLRDYPIGDSFVARFGQLSRDELRDRQQQKFQRILSRAWQIPFYRRLYGEAGIERGDIKHLEDITKLPTFDKSDLMASIEHCPPLGDFHGLDTLSEAAPAVLHTTSGTTGKPQVLLFGPRSREIQNLLLARGYLFQGLRADDIVHLVYGFGMINGGHYVREALLHWTRALVLSAGTGVETPSVQQVELMRNFKATCIVGFADYIKRLAGVAREQGLRPGEDIPVRMISGHLGQEDRQTLSDSWGGCQVYDWYGVGDTGIIAAEGPDQDGLYVMEDAHYLELLEVDTGQPVTTNASGDMVVTVLFKDDLYPIIRFNTHDVSAWLADGSPLGLNLRRIRGFLGRSDNMVKLKGINIFPHAIGSMLSARAEFTGEFILHARRGSSGLDQVTVTAEVSLDPAAYAGLLPVYQALLKQQLGIEVGVQLTPPGSLAALTGIETRQKPIRLIDERHQ